MYCRKQYFRLIFRSEDIIVDIKSSFINLTLYYTVFNLKVFVRDSLPLLINLSGITASLCVLCIYSIIEFSASYLVICF